MLLKRVIHALVGLAVLAVVFVVIVRAVLASDLVRTTLEQQLSERLRQPVRIGEAHAAVVPRIAVDLRRVTVGDPPAVAVGSVRIVTGVRGLLARTVVDAEIVVADSRLEVPLLFAILAAMPRLPGEAPPPDRAFTIESIRTITLRDITLVGNGRELTLDMNASIVGDRLEVPVLTARAGSTRIEASGELTSIERLQGRFDAHAAPLDVAELIAIGSALAAPNPAADPTAGEAHASMLHLVVALTAPAARFAAWDVRDIETTLDIVPGRVTASPLSFGLAGGTAAGRLEAETAAPTPRIRLTGRMDGVDIAEVMGPDGAPGGITGTLGGDVSLTASGTDPAAVMRTARGTIRAVVTDGVIPGMDMVRTVVLAFGRPAGAPPEGSGSAFSRLGGMFALGDGAMRSEDFAMESRDFDLAGSVELHLVTRVIDASVDVILSRELTAQAGTDLRRYAQEDGRVIIPARITGTLDRAVVSLDLAAVVKRAIGGELRRRVRSLFDDLLGRDP